MSALKPYPFESVNEHGTPITVLQCSTCAREFAACPAIPADRLDQWAGCMADDCASYDVERDASIWLDAAAEAGLVVREDT